MSKSYTRFISERYLFELVSIPIERRFTPYFFKIFNFSSVKESKFASKVNSPFFKRRVDAYFNKFSRSEMLKEEGVPPPI